MIACLLLSFLLPAGVAAQDPPLPRGQLSDLEKERFFSVKAENSIADGLGVIQSETSGNCTAVHRD
jgi:hypothetical protein